MYPETMANDNPALAGNLSPRRGSGFRSLEAERAGWWRALHRRLGRTVFCLVLAILFNCEAEAAGKLRLAVQKTGTFAWELGIISERGLDRKAGLDIEVTELASPEAGKIALMGGSADMILGDWLWVARQRNLGRLLVFAPYSTALGAVMVPAASPIEDLGRLERQKNRGRGRSFGQELAIASGARARIEPRPLVANERRLWRAGAALSEGREWRGRRHLKLLEFLHGARSARVSAAHRH